MSRKFFARLLDMSDATLRELCELRLIIRFSGSACVTSVALNNRAFPAGTTLGEVLGYYGDKATLQNIRRAPVLPGPECSRLDLANRIQREEPWTQKQKEAVRWHFVREGIDLGKSWDKNDDDGAYAYAVMMCAGSSAEGDRDTMRAGYNETQKLLPETSLRS